MSSIRSSRNVSAAPKEKDIYLFLVDADHSGGVSEDYQFVVNTLLAEKIFAESADEVCIRRIGNDENLKFSTVTWETLKTFSAEASLNASVTSPGALSSLLAGCKAIAQQNRDIYLSKKVIYFGDFGKCEVSEKELQKLKTVVDSHEILLTIVFPKEVSAMDSMQENNYSACKRIFESSENLFVFTYKKCLGKVLNRVAKKAKRSMASRVQFDIGGAVHIPVKKLIINRKNSTSFQNEKKEAKQRETVWTTNDGTAIDESEISTAYMYGDQIVSTGVSDESGSQPEDACLKLLVFCPRQNIQPAYLVGNGTDIYLAEEDDLGSYLKLNALVKALHRTKTIAVVRKVWRKNAAPHIGVLVPDMDRKGLIYTDVCFADDISTPHFPPLVKETVDISEVGGRDSLIDELITARSIPEFFPEEGPVDPADLIVRQHVTNKLISKPNVNSVKGNLERPYDSLELFFENFILSKEFIENVKVKFPLVPTQTREDDRPSGLQVFRKRLRNEESNDDEDKKIKLEETASDKNLVHNEEAEPMQDMDSLLDDL